LVSSFAVKIGPAKPGNRNPAFAGVRTYPGMIRARFPRPPALPVFEEFPMSPEVTRRQVLATGAAVAGTAAVLAPLALASAATRPATAEPKSKPTIVLVHGGYADSSCWNQTLSYLQGWGYATICGANPLRGIPTDAPYLASLLDSIAGPVVLVAHSMGGTVITNAAAGKANVKALVYICAFVPDVGETQGGADQQVPRQ
jgi:hypothetical protein